MNSLKHKPPTIGEGLLIILLLQPVLNLFFRALEPLWVELLLILPQGQEAINGLFLSGFLQGTVIIAVVLFIIKGIHQLPLASIGFMKPKGYRWIGTAAANGVLLFVVMMVFSGFIDRLLPNGLAQQEVTKIIWQAKTPWERLVPFLVTGLLAPVSEEMLFRGFIFTAMNQQFDNRWAMIVTALLFGAMHSDFWRMLPLALGGIWLNLLVVKTHSLYPAMVAHGVWNTIMVGLIYWT